MRGIGPQASSLVHVELSKCSSQLFASIYGQLYYPPPPPGCNFFCCFYTFFVRSQRGKVTSQWVKTVNQAPSLSSLSVKG